MTRATLDVRMTQLEDMLQRLEAKLANIEKQLASRIDSTNGTVAAIGTEQVNLEGRVGGVESKFSEVASRVEVCAVRLDEWEKAWPALGKDKETSNSTVEQPAEAEFQQVKRKKPRTRANSAPTDTRQPEALPSPPPEGTKKVSCGERIRLTKDKVVLVGDSLARGVGYKLQAQCGNDLVHVEAKGGARIEDITRTLRERKHDERRHLYVVAGANNMVRDSHTVMLQKYEALTSRMKQLRSKRVTMVGLMKRYDLGDQFECKRVCINAKLKEMCQRKGIEYLEFDPWKTSLHKDGLHLNSYGQIALGKVVFTSFKSFLV